MAVTKFIILIPLFFLAACGVENQSETPGSLDCHPTDAEIATFNGSVLSTLNATCAQCHGNSSTAYAYPTRFKLEVLDTSTQAQKNNLCIVYAFGQRSPTKEIYTRPQLATHEGGQYSESELQFLIDWVDTYTLPSDQ